MTRKHKILAALAFTSVAVFAADLQRGKQLYEEKNYKDAERELQAVTNADPDNAEAQKYLGLARIQQGKVKEAEAPLKKADEAGSSADTKLGLARIAIENKDLDTADALINQAAEMDGGNADIPFNRGLMKASRKEYAESVKDLELAIQKNPENAYAHYYAGLSYNAMKRPDKMIEHFQKFVKLAPDAPEKARVQSILKTVR